MLLDISPLKISRDYRLLFFGQLISFFGSMMTFIVVPWQMYELTGSSAMVGYIYLAEFVPMVVLAFVGGALADDDDVVFVSSDVRTVLTELGAEGLENIWLVGGGALTGSFLQKGLIDEFIISVIPILLGDGIRLFPASGQEAQLELIGSTSYPSGLVQAHYRRRQDN